MNPERHPSNNVQLGKSKDWDADKHGECMTLPVTRIQDDKGVILQSHWTPTPEELALLNTGGTVCLHLHGPGHPPVWLTCEPKAWL